MENIFICALVILLGGECLAQRDDAPEFYLRTKKKKIAVILADIGSGEGWLDAAFGIYKDSLRFYLQDIDSAYIKKGRLSEALKSYSHIKGKSITCRYVQAVGTEKNTNLPSSYFDKVLLIDTYHHFSFPDEMITDLKRILKPEGKLIVNEVIARKPGDVYKPCRTVIYTQDQVISSFHRNGFRLGRIFKTVNSNGKKVRVFTFYN
jgi:ubiquinone/menaquinone biosynthesis C-methylase UbiE